MTPLSRSLVSTLGLLVLSAAPEARAFVMDGEGHYGLRGQTRVAPAFSKSSGTFQAIEQTFRMRSEARFNDQASMFLEMRLFDNLREAYLGDRAEPLECPAKTTGEAPKTADPAHPCAGEYQNTGEPNYRPYTPRFIKAYVRYAFDYCILEAGRRGRNWGLGIFMDGGDDPFDVAYSVYDGVTCNVNLQKTQTLGFSFGYDKLAETGTYVDASDRGGGRRFGANDSGDDVDQYFMTIEYDDRKANAGAAFTKQVGVYFAQVSSRPLSDGGSNTDLKFLDLYTGFYVGDLSLRNEVVFRMGKSADPNWKILGGATIDPEDGSPATNKLDSIGFAGTFEWTLAHSGAVIGPAEYNKGDASRHVAFVNYAYAPGDKQGYYSDSLPGINAVNGSGNPQVEDTKIRTADRDRNATAMAFHRNYKPALILFNQRPEADRLIIDGAFNPSRVENATLLAAGYRYESLETGNIEGKIVTARLNSGIPGSVQNYYAKRKDCSGGSGPQADCTQFTGDDGSRPAGYYGDQLGVELDLTYTHKFGRDAEIGVAAAAAVPGDAWQTSDSIKPVNDYLVQSFVNFRF